MKVNNSFMYILGALITVCIIAVIGALLFVPVPEQNQRILDMCLGGLLVQFASVVNYFFGSSKGSADKTEMINAAKNGNPT